MTRETKIAFVGAGLMAREHARAFAAVPGTVLTGVFSRTRSKAEELAAEFGLPVVATSVDDLARATHADLVVVAVNEPSVSSVCTAVFAHPWKVLVEKPPGHDLATARGLLALAQDRRADVGVALNRRFFDSTQRLQSELNSHAGARFIQIFDQESPREAREYGHREPVLGNWMFANAIHMIDFLPILGRGEITDVTVNAPWLPDEPCCVAAHVTFSSGDHGSYQGVWEGPGPWAVAVSTPAARFEMRPLEKLFRQAAGSRTAEPVELPVNDASIKPGLLAQAQAAVDRARGGSSSLPTLATAVATMELIDRIFFPQRH